MIGEVRSSRTLDLGGGITLEQAAIYSPIEQGTMVRLKLRFPDGSEAERRFTFYEFEYHRDIREVTNQQIGEMIAEWKRTPYPLSN